MTHERNTKLVGDDLIEIRPFSVEIGDAAIDDLRERLARTRWPEKEPVEDWSMGIPLAYVQELAGYWAESYEMRRVADQLNRCEQFTTTINGVDIGGASPKLAPSRTPSVRRSRMTRGSRE